MGEVATDGILRGRGREGAIAKTGSLGNDTAMDISDLQDFAFVAQHGGFGAASRASGRSKATFARRIAQLEERLAVRLFERGKLGLKLSAAGRELLERISAPLKEIEAAAAAVSAPEKVLRGRLRINAAVVFAHAHLARIAATFSRLHPGVELEVVADDRMVDLVEDDFDIVIRANPAPRELLVGKLILRTDRVAVALPGTKLPIPGVAAPLVFRSSQQAPAVWRLKTNFGPREVQLRPALQLSTLMMMREAVINGAGVALLPRTLIEEDLRSGRLECWGIEEGAPTEVWALHRSRRLVNAKVRAFLQHLEQALAEAAMADDCPSPTHLPSS